MKTTWERIPDQFAAVKVVHAPGPLPTDCWIWQGSVNDSGYGMVGHFRAHRLSYEIANGAIPDNLLIRHRCHVRKCVNPGHLVAGTHADNSEDSRRAGRIKYGDDRPETKLRDADVVKVLALHATGTMQKDLATRFGVSRSLISQIVRGKKRADVLRRSKTKETK